MWDATYLAPSYLTSASRKAGAVAVEAEQRKRSKHTSLDPTHLFIPFVVETSGVVGSEALNFLQDLVKRLRRATGEAKSRHNLLQRLSVTVQRGNAVAVLGSIGGLVILREGEVF